jgi:hypothetical protein
LFESIAVCFDVAAGSKQQLFLDVLLGSLHPVQLLSGLIFFFGTNGKVILKSYD